MQEDGLGYVRSKRVAFPSPSFWQVLAACLALSLTAAPQVAPADITDEQVSAKIEDLIELIYDERNEHGIWDPPERRTDHQFGTNWGGTTAIMTFALLTAGESYQSPRLRPAIEFLRNAELNGTYAVAMRAHVWAAMPDEFGNYLRRDVQWLIRAMGEDGYDYTQDPRPGRVDNSVTQYGVLGVWEGAKRGVPVPTQYWTAVQEHFLRYQHDNGGWSYDARGGVRGSMVAAGLAAFYITQDYLHRNDFREVGRTNSHPLQRRIDRGLDWFARNYRPDTNPGIGQYNQYYHYGVERVGLASGVTYFAGHDWYREGGEWLLQRHGADTDAAFSLMFLVRGRVPVFMNKLEIVDYHWNNRPRDVANLTQWASDESERAMIWQVAHMHSDPEQWMEAPMLYISGHEALELTSDQQQKLKRYIDLGGLLVTTADTGSEAFSESVEQMLGELYPDYQLQSIDEEDEILDIVYQLDPQVGGLNPQTLHNGVRHLAIHFSQDISWALHADSQGSGEPWEFLTNAYFYATERGRNRGRLDQHYLPREGSGGGPSVAVGRVSYNGNYDPEPLAWEVLGNYMHNNAHAAVEVQNYPLSNLPDPSAVPLVHVVGTEAHTFTEEEREAIRTYAEQGGLILFENVGGRGDFATSATQQLNSIFETRLRPMSQQVPSITGEGTGGYDVSRVTYRPFTLLRMGHIRSPRLLALTLDDEVRVVVSGEDLTQAVLLQPVWGVFGYSSESAQRIMTNLVLAAAHRHGELAEAQ